MNKKKAEKSAKTPVSAKPGRLRSVFFVLMTLVFAGFTVAILTIIPRSTAVELEATTGRLSFSLPEGNDAAGHSLLYSSLWTDTLSIAEFQQIELNVISFENENPRRAFKNPLRFSPASRNARIVFHSNKPDISVQELFCSSGSRLTFQKSDKVLSLEIQDSSRPAYATLSFGELLSLSLQACHILDANGENLDQYFNRPIQVRLHELSRSLSVVGREEGLSLDLAMNHAAADSLQMLFRQTISSVDFFKTIILPGNTVRQSTIDHLVVQRNFPLESQEFKSRSAGDLEVRSEPDDFILYDLFLTGAGLRARLGANLSSLKVSQGAISAELVPGFLSFITKNPTTSIIITWLGWILTIFIPLFTKLFPRNS